MNEILQVLVGILGGGALGGIAGAIASSIAAKQKIKELEFAYQQKLRENFNANINLHVETLYNPLAVDISRLLNQSNKYQKSEASNRQQATLELRLACEKFVSQVLEMHDQGMSIYLTRDLDNRLRSFTTFITTSLDKKSHFRIRSFTEI